MFSMHVELFTCYWQQVCCIELFMLRISRLWRHEFIWWMGAMLASDHIFRSIWHCYTAVPCWTPYNQSCFLPSWLDCYIPVCYIYLGMGDRGKFSYYLSDLPLCPGDLTILSTAGKHFTTCLLIIRKNTYLLLPTPFRVGTWRPVSHVSIERTKHDWLRLAW